MNVFERVRRAARRQRISHPDLAFRAGFVGR
jgi:hypothetical protein